MKYKKPKFAEEGELRQYVQEDVSWFKEFFISGETRMCIAWACGILGIIAGFCIGAALYL